LGWAGPQKVGSKCTWDFLAHIKMGPGWSIGLQADPLSIFHLIFFGKNTIF